MKFLYNVALILEVPSFFLWVQAADFPLCL